MDRFIADPAHEAVTEGWVTSRDLGFEHEVEHGRFNRFTDDRDERTRRMIYLWQLTGDDGQPHLLDGYKEVRDDPGVDAWSDNTTLFTTIRRGWQTQAGARGPVVGQGIMHVRVRDLIRPRLTRVHAQRLVGQALPRGDGVVRLSRDKWPELIAHYVSATATSADPTPYLFPSAGVESDGDPTSQDRVREGSLTTCRTRTR